MGFSLNKVQLIGNLGKDGDTRFTTSGTSVTTFSIATVHSYKGKDGNYVNTTTWHNITAWALSDYMKEQLVKGKKFYVEGRISEDKYTDKDGNEKKAYKIIAEQLIPLENNGRGNGGGNQSSHNNDVYSGQDTNSSSDDNSDLPF